MFEYSEQASLGIAEQLKSTITQRFWVERDPSKSVERVLRHAAELAGMECKWVRLSQCYPMDLEGLLKGLPDKPGIIVLDDYDRSEQFLVDLVNFMVLYYEYRKMVTLETGSIDVPLNWKFVIITEPRAWINSPELHKLLFKLA